VIEICFASGSVFNVAGPDLVIFGTDNSAWGHGPYLVSTNFDAFANQVVVPASAATFTGESRYYWEPMGSVWVADVWATPLDLSSLGVPANAPVDRVRFNLSSGCLGIGALWYPNVGATYCTAGTTSHGCAAMVTGTGTASASASSGFDIRASNVEGQRMGLIFYGQSTGAWPWAIGSTSFVCVGAPVQRMGTTNSAGTLGACDGELLTDWNAFRSSHPNAVGSPFAAGQVFYAQAWFRDPGAVKGTSLSNAPQFFASP
jgi:hypothetical protein